MVKNITFRKDTMDYNNHWRISVVDLGDTDNDMDRSIAPDIQMTLTIEFLGGIWCYSRAKL